MKSPTVHIAEMTRELASRLAQGNVADSDIPKIANEIIKKKRLELNLNIAGHPNPASLWLTPLETRRLSSQTDRLRRRSNGTRLSRKRLDRARHRKHHVYLRTEDRLELRSGSS